MTHDIVFVNVNNYASHNRSVQSEKVDFSNNPQVVPRFTTGCSTSFVFNLYQEEASN